MLLVLHPVAKNAMHAAHRKKAASLVKQPKGHAQLMLRRSVLSSIVLSRCYVAFLSHRDQLKIPDLE